MSLSDLGNRVANWQRQVSALQLRLIALRTTSQQHLTAADALRLKREIAQGLEMSRREWATHRVPAPRRALMEQSCAQLLDALVDIERSSGQVEFDL